MSIKAPAWVVAKGGIPTTKGWKHPSRNEILLPRKFSQAEIDDYLGVKPTKKKKALKPAPAIKEVQEETSEVSKVTTSNSKKSKFGFRKRIKKQ